MGYKQYEPEVLKRIQQEDLNILKEFVRICDKYGIEYFAVYGTNIGAVRHNGVIPWDDDVDVGMIREEYERFLKVAPKEMGNRYGIAAPECGDIYCGLVTKFYKKGTRFATLCDHGKFHMGIYIDIFVFDYLAEEEKAQRRQVRTAELLRKIHMVKNVNFYTNEMMDDKPLQKVLFGGLHCLLNILPVTNGMIRGLWKKNAVKYHGRSSMLTQFSSTMVMESMIYLEETRHLIEVPYEDMMIKVPENYDRILRSVYGNYMELPPLEERQNHYPYILEFSEEGNEENEKSDNIRNV